MTPQLWVWAIGPFVDDSGDEKLKGFAVINMDTMSIPGTLVSPLAAAAALTIGYSHACAISDRDFDPLAEKSNQEEHCL